MSVRALKSPWFTGQSVSQDNFSQKAGLFFEGLFVATIKEMRAKHQLIVVSCPFLIELVQLSFCVFFFFPLSRDKITKPLAIS